jgi:hypothetical protein
MYHTLVWIQFCWSSNVAYRSRYIESLRAGRSGDRIPVEGEIFHTRPDRPCPLYNGYRVFLGGKAAGAWRRPPTST